MMVAMRVAYTLEQCWGAVPGGTAVAAGGNISANPAAANFTPSEDIVYTDPDNPYAVIPGGQRQRTLAYRFGVNLVMYALTGNASLFGGMLSVGLMMTALRR